MKTRIISRKKQIKEEWKRIMKVEKKGKWYDVTSTKDIDELYVSNYGKIKKIRTSDQFIITYGSNTHGYREVGITYIKNGKHKSSKFAIHRLVAYAFLNKPVGTDRPNHKDGCRHNNHISNLEWTNAKGNTRHAVDSGLLSISKGSERSNVKLDDRVVYDIIEMILRGDSNEEIASTISNDGYDCSADLISSIRNKRKWKHLTSGHTFTTSKCKRVNKNLDINTIEDICKLILENNSNSDIVSMLKLDKEISRSNARTRVRDIRNKRSYINISDLYFKEPYKLS